MTTMDRQSLFQKLAVWVLGVAVMVRNTAVPRSRIMLTCVNVIADGCLDQLARAICAEDNDHIHPEKDDASSLASQDTCQCVEGH